MGKLILILFILLTVNAFGQINFNFIGFKVEEKDSATSAICNLIVKSKTDSFLIQNIEKQKNIAIPIDSTSDFIFEKGQKTIMLYNVIRFLMPSDGYNSRIVFDSDTSCTIITYWEEYNGFAYTQASKWPEDSSHCSCVNFDYDDFSLSKKIKFKKFNHKH